MTSALVILHLSSLDAYAELDGVEAARDLAGEMHDAILEHDGPVIIVDQRWPMYSPISGPRHDLVHSVQLKKDIDWIHHDDNNNEWSRTLMDIVDVLRKYHVDEVILGGFWYDPLGVNGCVTESLPYFRRRFKRVTVKKSIVACVPSGK